MKIPKIIHYIWLTKGGSRDMADFQKCVQAKKSWDIYFPAGEYSFMFWNFDNCKQWIYENRYAHEAYDYGHLALVSDYIRLKVLHKFGGLYLDCDIEVRRTPAEIFESDRFTTIRNYFDGELAILSAVLACPKGDKLCKMLLDDYTDICYVGDDGSRDTKYNNYRMYDKINKLYPNFAEAKCEINEPLIKIFPKNWICFPEIEYSPIAMDTVFVHLSVDTNRIFKSIILIVPNNDLDVDFEKRIKEIYEIREREKFIEIIVVVSENSKYIGIVKGYVMSNLNTHIIEYSDFNSCLNRVIASCTYLTDKVVIEGNMFLEDMAGKSFYDLKTLQMEMNMNMKRI